VPFEASAFLGAWDGASLHEDALVRVAGWQGQLGAPRGKILVPEAFLPEDDQGPGDGVDDAGLAVDGPAVMELLADDRDIFLPMGR
jgi:hypothetical protein